MGNILECFKNLTSINTYCFRKTNKFKPIIINNDIIPSGIQKNDEEKDYMILTVEDFDKIL